MIRLTIFNEFWHEQQREYVKEIYPEGLHKTIGEAIKDTDISVNYVTIYDENMETQPDFGLTDEVLENTDVLMWWGHKCHNMITDELCDRVVEHVKRGMGIIFLHSGHHSKPFKKLMGTTCNLKWRGGARERIWVIDPTHPIVAGLNKEFFDIPCEEMYGEHFDIPDPEKVIMIGCFERNEVMRCACTWTRSYGKIFYFQPGHESCPTFHIPEVQLILKNAVRWANPTYRVHEEIPCPQYFEPTLAEIVDPNPPRWLVEQQQKENK